MLVTVAVTDAFPCSAVPLAGGVTARELLIVLLHNLGMLFTVQTIGQLRAAGVAARPLWFHRHGCLLSGQKKSPAVFPARLRAARAAVLYSVSLIIYYHNGGVDIFGQSRTFRAHFI